MKFCKYCGSQILGDESVCPACKKKQESPSTVKSHFDKRIFWLIIAVILLAVLGFLLAGSGKCQESDCKNKAVAGSDYCYSHKCALQSCNKKRFLYSNYCYSHYLEYDDDAASNSNRVSASDLELEVTRFYLGSTGNYYYAEGTVKNSSSSTVSYVKVKCVFTDSSGNVIDTNWTYAVGSEGLEPGESQKWEMMVSYDRKIDKCRATILDFNS